MLINRIDKSKPWSRFLDSQIDDFLVDLRSHFYGSSIPRMDIVDRWISYSGLFENEAITDDLRQFERDEIAKVGPFSTRKKLIDRIPSIEAYFSIKRFNPNVAAASYATDKLHRLISPCRLRPISLEKAYLESDKTTQWGAPFWASGNLKGEEYLHLANQLIDEYKSWLFLEVILGFRGQPSGSFMSANRVVWMYPHSVILIEQTYLKVLLKVLKDVDEFCMLTSVERASVHITSMLKDSTNDNEPIHSIDFSGYDASLSKEIIGNVFNAFRLWFQPNCKFTLDRLEEYFTESSLTTGIGVFVGRKGAVPSGSGFTNLVDSLCQYWIFWYSAYVGGCDLSRCKLTTMGDDGVWYLPGLDPTKLSHYLAHINLLVRPDKVMYKVGVCTFCKRIFTLDYMTMGICSPIRSTIRCISGMMSFERQNRSIDKSKWLIFNSIRWMSQIEECKYHPLFEKLVVYGILGDPLYLGLRIGGPNKLFTQVQLEETWNFFGNRFRYTNVVRQGIDPTSMAVVKEIYSYASSEECRLTLGNLPIPPSDLSDVGNASEVRG